MSGVIYLRDIPSEYRQIGSTIDNIDENDSRRKQERTSGNCNIGQQGDQKLDGFEYGLFCKQLKEQINFETSNSIIPNDAYHCWGDNVKFANRKYDDMIKELNYAADIRQKKAGGPMQWAFNFLQFLGIDV